MIASLLSFTEFYRVFLGSNAENVLFSSSLSTFMKFDRIFLFFSLRVIAFLLGFNVTFH